MNEEYIIVTKVSPSSGRILEWGTYSPPFNPLDGSEVVENTPDGAIKAVLPEEEAMRFYQLNGLKHIIQDGTIVYDETLPKYRGYYELENMLIALKEEMQSQDYKQMKYMRGTLPEEEWIALKAWYAEKIAEYNAIEAEFNIVKGEMGL